MAIKEIRLKETSPKPSWQLLHFRRTRECDEIMGEAERESDSDCDSMDSRASKYWGTEWIPRQLGRFAEWAFNPTNGLPELQVLAFGDFSHHGRWKTYSAFFERMDPAFDEEDHLPHGVVVPFRCFESITDGYEDFLEQYKDFLGVCNTDNVMDM